MAASGRGAMTAWMRSTGRAPSGLTSPVLVHDRSRDIFLRHWAAVVVHFGLRPGHLRGVAAVDGDAGVGAGFSGVAHDVGERGVWGRRVEIGLLSGSGGKVVV